MSNAADFESQLAALQAIPVEALKKPAMPIKQYIQEGEFLYHWCQVDKAPLTKAGLDWALVEDLLPRVGALMEAESRWFYERFSREDAQKLWGNQSEIAYGLRDKLLRDMRFAYRKDEALMKRVAGIAEGHGHADMLQDLNDLAILGRENTAPLKAIDLDLVLLDRAAELADTLSGLLAQATGERKEGNAGRILRDQAYTHLKAAVDEIRDHGQYVFWDNAARRDGYFSDYVRSTNARAAKRQDASEPPVNDAPAGDASA